MRKFAYKKLIRDKILDHMHEAGEEPEFRILGDQQYRHELKQKILEEGTEITIEDTGKLLNELADLQEVIDCLLETTGMSRSQLQSIQHDKAEKYGSFRRKIFIDTVAIPDSSPWIRYLKANPDRYPEVDDDPKLPTAR